jgi:hypothetical protein
MIYANASRVLMLTLGLMMTFPHVAWAECAWVLWSEENVITGGATPELRTFWTPSACRSWST